MTDSFQYALQRLNDYFGPSAYNWNALVRPNVAYLGDATDPAQWGGKAAALSVLLGKGIRVPSGIVARKEAIRGFLRSHHAVEMFLSYLPEPRSSMPLAIRSSAIGEDGLKASFAGRYESRLNLYTGYEVYTATGRVIASAKSDRALSYRRRMGLDGEAEICLILQRMIIPSHSAVVFTRDPVTGAHELVIEVTEGVGDRLVSGEVEPATFNMNSDGDSTQIAGPRMDAPRLTWLASAALSCEQAIGAAADVEAAFDGREWWVVQARPITTLED